MLQDNARPPSFSFRSLPGLAPTSLISISFISPCLRFYLPAKLSFCCLLSHKLFLAFQPWTICSLCQNPFVANSPARSRPWLLLGLPVVLHASLCLACYSTFILDCHCLLAYLFHWTESPGEQASRLTHLCSLSAWRTPVKQYNYCLNNLLG